MVDRVARYRFAQKKWKSSCLNPPFVFTDGGRDSGSTEAYGESRKKMQDGVARSRARQRSRDGFFFPTIDALKQHFSCYLLLLLLRFLAWHFVFLFSPPLSEGTFLLCVVSSVNQSSAPLQPVRVISVAQSQGSFCLISFYIFRRCYLLDLVGVLFCSNGYVGVSFPTMINSMLFYFFRDLTVVDHIICIST